MLALTDFLGRDVTGADGTPHGRLEDLAVDLAERHPAVTALLVRRGRGAPTHAIPWSDVASFEHAGVELNRGAPSADVVLGEALLLRRDVLDTQIVDVAGRRVVRVADVELARDDGQLRVVAVDVGGRALLQRMGLRRLARRARRHAVDWHELHPASRRGHALALRAPAASIQTLDGAQLAELVARLPVERAAEVLRAVSSTSAAGALSAARPGLGGRLVDALHAAEAGPILAQMPTDDATAALRHLGPERLDRLLAEVSSERGVELRRLLAYPARTAGGLMTTDVRTARPGEPVEAIRARLAADPPRLEGLMTVFVVDEQGRVQGAIAPSALVAGSATPAPVPIVAVDTPVDEVVDLFALHDVLALPVVDAAGRLVGAVAVDDVLEELLAERLPGRRRRWALFDPTRRRRASP